MLKQFRLDPGQFRVLMQGRKNSPSRFLTFDRILEIAKLIAILLAGGWTIFLYFSGQKLGEELKIEQTKLQNVSAEFEIRKIKMESEMLERKEAIALAGDFSLNAEIRLNKSESEKLPHSANLDYKFTNNGDIPQTVEVVIVEWYAGEISKSSSNTGIVITNEPPVGPMPKEDDNSDGGAIIWEKAAYKGCRNEDSSNYLFQQYDLHVGGCATNVYQPGASMEASSYVFLMQKRKPKFIGASIFVRLSNGSYIFKSLSQCVSC